MNTHSPVPEIVAILNLTPDSFSDGGGSFSSQAALENAERMVAAGVQWLDIGAESTRPGATPLTAVKEWERLEPVLPALLARWGGAQSEVTISLDTRHAETAVKALALGAQAINDVSGAADRDLLRAVAAYPSARYVLMHSLSIPADPAHTLPQEEDPVAAVVRFAEERLAALEALGIARERVILDPGIGFGKSAAQSWVLLRRIGELRAVGLPLMVGHSRKSFLREITGGEAAAAERDAMTLAVSLALAEHGVEYLRVHAALAHLSALAAWRRLRDV